MNLIYRWVIHAISNIAKIFMREVMLYTEERREAIYKCTSLYKVHNNFSPKYLSYITDYVNLQSIIKLSGLIHDTLWYL